MDKNFEEIRDMLKPQKYSEIMKTNCFGEFIEADNMIKILDYIRRQNDKIKVLEQKLQASEKASNCILGDVSLESLKANLKILIFNAREDWNRFDSEGNEFASRKAYGQFMAYKNLLDGINNGAFKD